MKISDSVKSARKLLLPSNHLVNQPTAPFSESKQPPNNPYKLRGVERFDPNSFEAQFYRL